MKCDKIFIMELFLFFTYNDNTIKPLENFSDRYHTGVNYNLSANPENIKNDFILFVFPKLNSYINFIF